MARIYYTTSLSTVKATMKKHSTHDFLVMQNMSQLSWFQKSSDTRLSDIIFHQVC